MKKQNKKMEFSKQLLLQESMLIWIIVGSVGGAVVLGTIIFLIVFFARRRGFGGSGKIKTYSKKDYKNMYF